MPLVVTGSSCALRYNQERGDGMVMGVGNNGGEVLENARERQRGHPGRARRGTGWRTPPS